MSIQRSSHLQGKGSTRTFNAQLFQDPEYWSGPGNWTTTSCSAVKCSTDWASPAATDITVYTGKFVHFSSMELYLHTYQYWSSSLYSHGLKNLPLHNEVWQEGNRRHLTYHGNISAPLLTKENSIFKLREYHNWFILSWCADMLTYIVRLVEMHQTSEQVKIVDLDLCHWLACLLRHEIFSKDEKKKQ